MIKTLQQWVDASPNAFKSNTLIKGIGVKDGKPVYHYYHWNLKPVDPDEQAVYTDLNGKVITVEAARALL